MKFLVFQKSSAVRKFEILFLLVSVIPLSLLFYLYLQLVENNLTVLSAGTVRVTILWVILGIICGYWTMRQIVLGFASTTKIGQQEISRILEKGSRSAVEANELPILQETFSEVALQLAADRKRLDIAKQALHSVLTKVSEGLTSDKTIDGLIHIIVESVNEALMGQCGAVFLFNKETHQLEAKIIVGKKSFFVEDAIITDALSVKKALIDLEHEPSIVCAPLHIRDHVLGVLAVYGRRVPGVFQEDDGALLYSVALQMAIAIDNQELKHLANTDPLTNIFNYRHLIESLNHEVARMRRSPGDLSLLMIDLDDFKAYNDLFGHSEGNHLLQELTIAVRSRLRETDILCRFGGDEFALILPMTDINGAHRVMENVRLAVGSLKLKKPITVSIGDAQWVANMSGQDIITQADNALTRIKRESKAT